MELIDQRTKKIMEECKARAKVAGLEVQGETLEYIVTNRDLIELSPKIMIPTLYDYWVNDVGVIRDKWIYDAYPYNPYETVINTRPAISFYNDNNPDWLNVMIFYHVLGHIDFFHNNVFYRKTWDDDFCGQALADKRFINSIRMEMGAERRWVDYVIEFARGIDNLVGYYSELEESDEFIMKDVLGKFTQKINFYFGEFLRNLFDDGAIGLKFYYDEVERYNQCQKEFGKKRGESIFFDDLKCRFPEFNSVFLKRKKNNKEKSKDILQYLLSHSEFLNKEKNLWMKDVIQVVRKTSLYFQPQFRDHICNEGWASFWHERLFMADERIRGHEVDYATINSGVLVSPRIGFNPYILGKNFFEFIEYLAKKGRLSYEFQLIKDIEMRKNYNKNLDDKQGNEAIFEARENFNDFMMVNFLSDENFQDFVDTYKLFVAGTRFNPQKGVFEIYIKSKSGKDYRKMVNKTLYHPPYILIDGEKSDENELYINHVFEGRTLVSKYIPAVLIGLSYFCGGHKVSLETTEFEVDQGDYYRSLIEGEKMEYKKIRVLYTCEKKKVGRTVLHEYEDEEAE